MYIYIYMYIFGIVGYISPGRAGPPPGRKHAQGGSATSAPPLSGTRRVGPDQAGAHGPSSRGLPNGSDKRKRQTEVTNGSDKRKRQTEAMNIFSMLPYGNSGRQAGRHDAKQTQFTVQSSKSKSSLQNRISHFKLHIST